MPKIMYIITRLDRGGSAEAVLQWAEGIKNKGFQVELVSGLTVEPHENLEAYSKRTGIEITFINSLHRELEPANDVRALWSLYRYFRREKPDIVHTNSSKAGLLGRVAAWLARTPVIVHSPHGHIFYGYYGKLKTDLFIFLERAAGKITDVITTLTSIGRDDHIKLKIAKPEKFEIVHAGIDIEKYRKPVRNRNEIRSEYKIPPDDFVVGWVGRFADIKNPLMFARTAEKLIDEKNIHFLMVGDGDLMPECKERVEKAGLSPKFTFTGFRSDVPDLLNAMDIYVLTSTNEGLGRSIIEAQAAGLPVAVSKVGGVPDIIEDGVNGVLVPVNDDDYLAGAIKSLKENSEKRAKLISSANERLSRFTLEKTIEDLEKIYKRLLAI